MIVLYRYPMLTDRREFLASAAATMLMPAASRAAKRGADPMGGDQVFELRQYTLRKGQRDTLIALFEQRFVEPQEALGAHVVGMFCDLDDSDRFVWLRGFATWRSVRRR